MVCCVKGGMGLGVRVMFVLLVGGVRRLGLMVRVVGLRVRVMGLLLVVRAMSVVLLVRAM